MTHTKHDGRGKFLGRKRGTKMQTLSKNRYWGVTLVEILLILSLLAIIASLAVPSMSGATAKAEMRAASENMQFSIRSAKNTARMTESTVNMILSEGAGEQAQLITFSVSRSGLKALGQPGLQENRLPMNIKLVSDYSSYEFDSRGMVQNPGMITLVSLTDESLITNIEVK